LLTDRDHSGGNSRASADDLSHILRQIDGRQYPSYKDLLRTNFEFGDNLFTLAADYIQGDPFASPSNFRGSVPAETAGFSPDLVSSKVRRVALADFLLRRCFEYLHARDLGRVAGGGGWSGEKGGDLRVEPPSQHVVERTSVQVGEDGVVEVRFTLGLPARGRTCLGEWAAQLLLEHVPDMIKACLCAASLDADAVRAHVLSVEDQEWLRSQLAERKLVAFVRNGAILPRASGSDDRPLQGDGVVPFQSPPSLACEFELPNAGTISGMGIPLGVTVIVGGGFHGKSTVLVACEKGVYNHVPGDGREFVVCNPQAVKIRAEDGRSVSSVNISTFINNLPFGKRTDDFSTTNASGSTSQGKLLRRV
jgi:predicted ABC-class ATPase